MALYVDSAAAAATSAEAAAAAAAAAEEDSDELELYDAISEVLRASGTSDFSMPRGMKQELVARFGAERFVDGFLFALRALGVPIFSANFPSAEKLRVEIERTLRGAEICEKRARWYYLEGGREIATEGVLLSPMPAHLHLSTLLSGHVRYTQPITSKPTPATMWANDAKLRQALVHHTNDARALNDHGLRTFCLQGGGVRYPTAFPIPVAAWFFLREARRLQRPLNCVVDPCAGWGDRLVAAKIVGLGVCEHYFGADPWDVSHQLCKDIATRLSSPTNCTVTLVRAPAQSPHVWPDADLVFTSPPYGSLEQYDFSSVDPATSEQAWRLSAVGRFETDFLVPLMTKAAACTRARRGRVIINMANVPRSSGSDSVLTRTLVTVANRAGLVQVEIIGMRLSPRATMQHGTAVSRGEPFFVFEHSP